MPHSFLWKLNKVSYVKAANMITGMCLLNLKILIEISVSLNSLFLFTGKYLTYFQSKQYPISKKNQWQKFPDQSQKEITTKTHFNKVPSFPINLSSIFMYSDHRSHYVSSEKN